MKLFLCLKMKIQNFVLGIFMLIAFAASAQEHHIGIKAGGNLAKFTDASGNNYQYRNRGDFKFKPGFFAGAFYTLGSRNYQFQPEILFSLQGTQVSKDDLSIPIFNNKGDQISSSKYDFEYDIHEWAITVPLMSRIFVTKGLFLEAGPQAAFIVERNLKSKYQMIDGEDTSFIMRDTDSFDFGINLGIGHHITPALLIDFRAYAGLIKRENEVKSIILNLSLEYRIW